MEVVESGVDAVREYLIGRMNGVGVKGKGKKKAWIWRMARCGMVDAGRIGRLKNEEDDQFGVVSEYHSVDGFGTPGRRYMEVLSSPLRLFSRQWSTPASPSPAWK